MCGQVKHAKIFSSIRPDWRLVKLLAALPSKNTDGLIGGVVKILEDEGIHLRESTLLLKPLLAGDRNPDKAQAGERGDGGYRIWPARRQCPGGFRCRAERRHLRTGVRGRGGDGGHGRDAAPRGAR